GGAGSSPAFASGAEFAAARAAAPAAPSLRNVRRSMVMAGPLRLARRLEADRRADPLRESKEVSRALAQDGFNAIEALLVAVRGLPFFPLAVEPFLPIREPSL